MNPLKKPSDGNQEKPKKSRSRSRSIERRMKDQEKQLTDQTSEQRRKRHAAKDVYGAIGFDLMYEDGICQVEDGLFSQTISFDDISYQSAREGNKKAVFSGWCQLFDYFGAESCVQLTVVNTPIPPSEIGKKVFFSTDDPDTAGYAREYNRILNDKMREGVSNLVRERYLTFSTGAASVDAAVPKLARMRSDAMQTLGKIRSDSRVLDREERLRAISLQLRPAKPFYFSWDQVGAEGNLTSKDFICPSTLDFKPEGSGACFKSDGMWCQVLSLHRFGSELTDRCLADIIDLPMPLNVTIHVQAIDKAKAVAFVKTRLAWMDKEIIDEQMSAVKKGYDFQILPSELKYSKEEAEDLLDHLQNRNQRLFVYTGLVYTYAATRKELDDQVDQIVATARQHSIEADALDYRQREGMNSILPLGHNHVEVSRMMTTAQVAIQMPFATQELAQDGGGYYGQNKQSSNLVLCNRKAHGIRLRQAGLRQVVLGEKGDREHYPGVPGRRDHHSRLGRRIQPGGDRQRRRVDQVRAGRGHPPQPLRPFRCRPPVNGIPDGVQDRRIPGAVEDSPRPTSRSSADALSWPTSNAARRAGCPFSETSTTSCASSPNTRHQTSHCATSAT